MNSSETSKPDAGLMSGLHSNLFALNSISSQYAKGIDLASLQESLSRAQTTLDESQNIRVKHLFTMTNNESITKHLIENQNASKSLSSVSNDRNNNKSSTNKDKVEASAPQFKEFDQPAEKTVQIHANSKSGVSLKCAYCEAREDFKSR